MDVTNTEVNRLLRTERRTKLLDLENPNIRKLWIDLEGIIAPSITPEANLTRITEAVLLRALMFAYRDHANEVSNKAGIEVEASAAIAVADKLGIPISLIYGDGKGFKEINDKLGHIAGDDLLRVISLAMKSSAKRASDITIHETNSEKEQAEAEDESEDELGIRVGRHGGDEFAVVLLNTDFAGAEVVAARMQQAMTEAVDAHFPQFQQVIGHPFGMTIGIVQYNPNIHHNGKALIKAADAKVTEVRQQMGLTRRS